MKLVTYRAPGEARDRVGVLDSPASGAFDPESAWVVDLSDDFHDMLALIDGGALALARAAEARERGAHRFLLGEVSLRAPLPEPRQMRDAMTFELHYRQSIRELAKMRVGRVAGALANAVGIARIPPVWYEQPTYYKCNRFSVVGPNADVVWPKGATLMDYECELGVVIGKTGKDIPRERAREHIFGYTIFNDMTARNLQDREMRAHLGPAKGKDFDTGNVLGPWLVTADEIPDPYDLTMIARVDGQEWGRGHSRDMYHRWEDVIAYVSRSETLYAGEFLGSGTCGNGCGLELGRFLSPNSVVELEITGLGKLQNRLVAP
jgi:2-keto-4-pentenoate hydratase/2-oxohepta-3-ene-1,7-dioic acid hydratase in catechol pathway